MSRIARRPLTESERDALGMQSRDALHSQSFSNQSLADFMASFTSLSTSDIGAILRTHDCTHMHEPRVEERPAHEGMSPQQRVGNALSTKSTVISAKAAAAVGDASCSMRAWDTDSVEELTLPAATNGGRMSCETHSPPCGTLFDTLVSPEVSDCESDDLGGSGNLCDQRAIGPTRPACITKSTNSQRTS